MFAVPAVVVNGNEEDFVVRHEGEREVESIDLMFVDSNKLDAIRSSPSQSPVLPSEYSVFLHIEKMYPKGRGSLFAKQFIWKPQVFEHQRYAVEISTSTGKFHEDLFVEKVANAWLDAARVDDVETKKTVFECRDKSFPKDLAPSVRTSKNCFPDWIK